MTPIPDALIAEHPEVPAELALRGFDGVRAYSSAPEASDALLTELGFERREGGAWEARGSKRGGTIVYEQPPLRVERLEEAEEVVLVGPAPVVEDERPGRLPGGLAKPQVDPPPIDPAAHGATCRGLATGFSRASTRSRRCS